MKNFFKALMLILSIGTLQAQKSINTEFSKQMEHTFQLLDKNKIPTGILLDASMEFINVKAFNGKCTDENYVTPEILSQNYNTLLLSVVNPKSKNYFLTPEQRNEKWNKLRQSNRIVLSGILFMYNFLAKDAYPKKINYNKKNQQFSDKYVNGVWQNPYEESQVFAMTTPIQYFKGLELEVLLPKEIFYTNTSNIKTIYIDVADGKGYQTISFDSPLAIKYKEEGNKIWKYKVELSNGKILESHSKIKIEKGIEVTPLYKTANSTNETMGTQSWNCTGAGGYYVVNSEAEIAYEGRKATVKIMIRDAGNDCQIRKPLIVAEGFDVGRLLAPENQYGVSDISSFTFNISNSQSTDLRNLLLYSNQYDIIYVNWDNGMDYLQRNAYALEEVIRWVNSVKVGTEKNVVLGQSMGGVIARYALTDMENRGINHDTRLFVSQDAPQQGANVPLGFQHLYRHLSNQYITTSSTLFGGDITVPIFENNFNTSEYLSILDAPAAVQMIKERININYAPDNVHHTNFYNELRNLNSNNGYPQLNGIRNIAISNGSECGKTQNFYPGASILSLNINYNPNFWGDLLAPVYYPLGGILGGLLLDPDFFRVGLLSLVPGDSEWIINFNANALKEPGTFGNSHHIYSGLVRYKKKVLWLLDSQVTITEHNGYQSPSTLAYDYYGGGLYNLSSLSGNAIEDIQGLTLRDRFSFIPTTSALDIGKGLVPLSSQDYKNAYIGASPPPAPKNSPFINFTTAFNRNTPTADNNERHLEFNKRNGDWLASELNNQISLTDCFFLCENKINTQSQAICNGASTTASVTQGADYYNWSIIEGSNLASITSSNNTNIITITANTGTASGIVTIRVIYGNPRCGTTSVTKKIWVGKPAVNITRVNEYCEAGKHFVVYQIIEPEGFSFNYQLVYPSVQGGTAMLSNKQIIFTFASGYTNDALTFTLKATNSCGTNIFYYEEEIADCSIFARQASNASLYTIAPNPADTQLQIELSNKPINEFEASLYNITGLEVAHTKATNGKAIINTISLPNGIYTLVLVQGNSKESVQVEIKH